MTVIQSAIMLFTLLLSSFVVISANPFHKYPFVFLLDVGNEVLDTVNTKQLRVSSPGGSVAVRYPAIGDGETIAHLRVSGIDFGTDLKASIISGGPGYKYVVLVFMGNEGVAYDAVVTIQTVPAQAVGYNLKTSNVKESTYTEQYDIQNTNINTQNKIVVDENNSAEDLSDDDVNQSVNSQNELSQSSSNVYYVKQASMEDTEERSNDFDDGEDDSEDNSHQDSNLIENTAQVDTNVDTNEELNSNDDDDHEETEGDTNNYDISETKVEKYGKADDSEDENNEEPVRFIDKNLYDKYQDLKPHFFNNFNVYPQEAISQNASPIDSHESIDFEDPSYLEQKYNGEELHDDKLKDNNNNYSDSDYGSIDYKK